MKPMKTIGLTCAILLLAISAKAATTDVPGVLKRQRYAGSALTRQQVANNDPILNTAPLQTSYPTGWDWDDGSADYVSRSSGLITPPSTGLYDFYVAADDDTDVYLSTNDNPTNKVLICQENGWAGGPRNWITAGGGGSSSAQKTSLTWTNGLGVAVHSGGISLSAGTWYYLEAAHNQGGGGGYVGVTMLPHLTAPVDGDGTTLTNGLIKLQIFTPTTLTVTGPTNVTTHSGVRARFAVSVTTDSQDGIVYQWRRGGVAISNATASSYTIIASTSDNGAQFDCVVGVPGVGTPSLTQTSAVATLTVAGGGVTVTGRLKRDLMAGMNNQPRRTQIENGNESAVTSTTGITALDVGSAGAGYGERIYGYFTPAVSDSYVFFVAGDDDTDVFLSTDSEPINKVLIAQEVGWSGTRNWITPGGAGSTSAQKRSDQFSPDGGATFPFQNGIPLTAGTPYYIEVVHNGGGGGNNAAVTAVTTNDAMSGIPVDGNSTTLSNAVLSYTTKAVTVFQITQQPTPTNNTVFEGLPWQIQVTVNTDSEVLPTFQWFKNNVAVPGATTSKIQATSAILAESGTYRVEVSLPGQPTLVSSNATLTVQAGVFVTNRLKLERWLNDVTSRQIVGAGVAGTYPDPDFSTFVTASEVPDVAGTDNFVQRLSGYFVPATTGLYTFYVASDDDTDVYLGTNDLASSKRILCQEDGWSNWRNWNTAGGGGSVVTQKRSDQWSPDAGATFPHASGIQLTAGQRYYFEAVHHDGTWGGHVSVAFTMFGDPAPTDGSGANVATGGRIGVLVPAATSVTITNQPDSVAKYANQPVYLEVGATSDGILPLTYQWRKNGTDISGATSPNYTFIPDLADSGAGFVCVVADPTVPSLTKTSTVATVTINAGAVFQAGELLMERWTTGLPSMAQLRAGGLGVPNVVAIDTDLDSPDQGISDYVQRYSGYFVPPVTTNYVFFTDSDDETDFYLGTSDLVSSKLLRCQEPAWSPGRYNWLAAAGGGLASQKRSDTWSPDGGATMPWSAGIPLVAGNHYYVEYLFHEGGGGDWCGVYYKFTGGDDPTNGAPANVTSALIGRLVPPPGRVLTVTRSGGNVNVSWTPTGGTLQSTTALPGGSWTDVGTANPASIPVGPGNLFLRVRE